MIVESFILPFHRESAIAHWPCESQINSGKCDSKDCPSPVVSFVFFFNSHAVTRLVSRSRILPGQAIQGISSGRAQGIGKNQGRFALYRNRFAVHTGEDDSYFSLLSSFYILHENRITAECFVSR